jgi:hypothetical protein
MRAFVKYLYVCLLLTVAASFFNTWSRCPAQGMNAILSGYVVDSSGAGIPNAKVVIRNNATNLQRQLVTLSEGNFVIPALPPGTYTLRAEHDGFSVTESTNITLNAADTRSVRVVLQVGSTQQAVEVNAEAATLNTSGTLSTVFETRAVEDLPNLERNPLNILFLSPGISPGTGDRQETTATGPESSINGGRINDNQVLIDGGETISLSSDIAVLNPSTDDIAEIKVLTNSYTAEFGRAIGGTMNITTKSGTNQLHGSLFEFNRLSAFAGKGYFAPRKLRLTRNQFGGSFGGPLSIPRFYQGKDHTFFFLSYEGLRQIYGLTNIGTVPTAAERGGDFSALTTLIYDPATTIIKGSSATRSAFPANKIPTNRLDPVALNVLNYYPLPTSSGFVNNYSLSLPVSSVEDRFSLRIDHNFKDRNLLFGRYLYDNPRNSTTNNAPRTLPDAVADPEEPQQPVPQQLVLGDTQIFNSHLLNDFRFTYFRFRSTQIPFGTGGDFPQRLGLSGVNPRLFPAMSISGYLPIGDSSINDTTQMLFAGTDTVGLNKGKHFVRVGGGFTRFYYNDGVQGALSGSFTFNQLPTADPGVSGTGNPFASFLLGYPIDTSVATVNPEFGYRWINVNAFIQDDYHLSAHLILNAGLRWDLETPIVEVKNLQSNWDPTNQKFIFAGVNGAPRTLQNTNWLDFGPRVGFAYHPIEHFTIRSGYGMYYADTAQQQAQSVRSTGFTATAAYNSPDDGITLPIKLSQGLPPLTINPGSVATEQNINVSVIPPHAARAQIQQWNLTLEQQISSFTAQASYIGAKGTHLAAAAYNINQVPDDLLGPGNAQPLRPYPNFQNIMVEYANDANSIYHGLTLSLNRRFSRGLTLISSFTWQKIHRF